MDTKPPASACANAGARWMPVSAGAHFSSKMARVCRVSAHGVNLHSVGVFVNPGLDPSPASVSPSSSSAAASASASGASGGLVAAASAARSRSDARPSSHCSIFSAADLEPRSRSPRCSRAGSKTDATTVAASAPSSSAEGSERVAFATTPISARSFSTAEVSAPSSSSIFFSNSARALPYSESGGASPAFASAAASTARCSAIRGTAKSSAAFTSASRVAFAAAIASSIGRGKGFRRVSWLN
mmetsp:Transcript_10991/g.50866  ORF Transcript_10991/g.50866 Transcript_10991/m.50866 type:complete len:243 (+) Transcript_10991:943-1671(+)